MITLHFKYTAHHGNTVVAYMKSNGFPQAELIGSLAKIGFSNNDIDIHVPQSGTKDDRDKIILLFQPCGKVDETDWGGIYLTDTRFGDIDIFFSLDGFDY